MNANDVKITNLNLENKEAEVYVTCGIVPCERFENRNLKPTEILALEFADIQEIENLIVILESFKTQCQVSTGTSYMYRSNRR